MRQDSSITEIKGIGEKTKKLFEKMEIIVSSSFQRALPMVSPFSQKQQSSNTSVITSIIQRQMEVSRFSMKPSVLIGRYLQSMPISLRKTQNMLC